MSFEPFDDKYEFDSSVLTEDFPHYLSPSVKKWIFDCLRNHSMYNARVLHAQLTGSFIHPLNRAFRKSFSDTSTVFFSTITADIVLFRNVLSYILQNIADVAEGRELEKILQEGSSAYTVEFRRGRKIAGILTSKGEPMFETAGMKLSYRVPPIVKAQAEEVISHDALLAEAWESHYGINPDDEKTVTRCTDVLAGQLRDKYFGEEKRTQLGTLLQKMRAEPNKYSLPASSLYDSDRFLEIMKNFSKIRGNHKTGTGRAPTHEEAGFVLHFTIMLSQLLRS